MDEVKEHIKNKEWLVDPEADKFFHYYGIAQKCCKSSKVEDLVSATLLYNQLVEKILKETIIISIVVVKTKVWPEKIEFDINFDKATFGKLIKYFKTFAIKKYNRNVIIKYLKEILPIRNKVIHSIFDVDDIENELKDYFVKADELILFLNGYYNSIAGSLLEEFDNFDFNNLLY